MERQNRNMNTPFQKFRENRDNIIRQLYKEGYMSIESIAAAASTGKTTVNRALKGLRNRRKK